MLLTTAVGIAMAQQTQTRGGLQLMMPVYPGSVEVKHPDRQITAEFLSKDSLERVSAFYRRQPGMPAPDRSRFEDSGVRFTLVSDDDPKMGLPEELAAHSYPLKIYIRHK